MSLSLVVPAFIAGILTFLAPCTLPLVPAYLGFISGASAKELQDPTKLSAIRARVFKNGLFYVLGFSVVFIVLGLLFGIGGAVLAQFQVWLSRIGGVFVIFFGLYLMHFFDRFNFLRFLSAEKHTPILGTLTPGKPSSSFIFGATFAFGWTPCVGPILATVLFLASSTATALQGALLLVVFSIGLALPFLALALAIGHAATVIKKLSVVLPYISFIGGLFLLILGILLLTDTLSIWLAVAYQMFNFVGYERILEYL